MFVCLWPVDCEQSTSTPSQLTVKHVTMHAQAMRLASTEGLDVFVAVVAPVYAPPSADMKCSENRNVQHVQNSYDDDRVASMVLRHATGPLTHKVFFHPTLSKAMFASSGSAINDVVKAAEKERRDKVWAFAATEICK